MLPHTLLTPALTCIFAKMAAIHNCTISVWQRSFLTGLFQTVFALRGRVNLKRWAVFPPPPGARTDDSGQQPPLWA